jgi:hypothetical protein
MFNDDHGKKEINMAITNKSDAEIVKIVQPMISSVVKASNQKYWELFPNIRQKKR